MDISLTTKGIGKDNLSWLGSSEGTSSADSITLDLTSGFTDADFYKKGFIPSGVPVTKLDSGLYGLYVDGSSTPLAGFVLTAQEINYSTSTRIGAPLLWRGEIVEANLPVALPAKGKTENTFFRFI